MRLHPAFYTKQHQRLPKGALVRFSRMNKDKGVKICMKWECIRPLEQARASVYTQAERERIERILAAFRSYLEANPRFEILNTKTLGYISLSKDGDAYLRTLTADGVVLELCDHVVLDTMAASGCGKHLQNYPTPQEEAEARRRYAALVANLPDEGDRAYCLRLLEQYLEAWLEVERPYLSECG